MGCAVQKLGVQINYNINIGDKILVMSPMGIESIVVNLPKQETYIVDSIFDSEIAEFDRSVAFININNRRVFIPRSNLICVYFRY